MIPRVEFRVSWVHNLMFDPNRYLPKEKRTSSKYSPKQGKMLIANVNPFIEHWKKIENRVLAKISEISGYAWNIKEIIVYISDTVPNSYEDPLTLKYHSDINYMTMDLVHELVHNIIPKKLQDEQSDKERENGVEEINLKVCKELGIESENYVLNIR